ncbi:MAG: DUF418 domain-containing protein [Acidobacteriota bacterium]
MDPAPSRGPRSPSDTPTAASDPGPVSVGERLGVLDAIRGAALGGILVANLISFFGVYWMSAEVRMAMAAGAVGEAVIFGMDWLIEGKFYSVFSILLGIGFAIQWQRAEARGQSRSQFGRFFRKRMTVLIGIGLLHMVGLWAGDILTLYGVMGLLLPTLARGQGRSRLAAIILFLMTPLAIHGLVYTTEGRLDPRPPFAELGAQVKDELGGEGKASLELFAEGNPSDYVAWNVGYAVGRPGTYLQGGRPFKVMGLFLIGAWIGIALLPRLASLGQSLRRTAIVGAAVGLPASFVYALIKLRHAQSTFMLSPEGLLQTTAYTLGTTPLALSYLALAVLAWRTDAGRRRLEWFVPLGRMALSVYISQTMIQLIAFTGWGFGLATKIPVALLPVVAAAILITQRQACLWWLARYRQGPLEWVWRRVTYR